MPGQDHPDKEGQESAGSGKRYSKLIGTVHLYLVIILPAFAASFVPSNPEEKDLGSNEEGNSSGNFVAYISDRFALTFAKAQPVADNSSSYLGQATESFLNLAIFRYHGKGIEDHQGLKSEMS